MPDIPAPKPDDWVRVSDLQTGHHFSIRRRALNLRLHRLLKRPGADAHGRPYAAKPRVGLPSPVEDAPPTESRTPAKPKQEGPQS